MESADQARAIVQSAKYPPQGRRGIGPWRASKFYDDFSAYMEVSNEHTLLVMQIESEKGLSNVSGVAQVEGMDVLYVGPADLSASVGLPLGVVDGVLLSACRKVAEAARQSGKTAAIDLSEIDNLQLLLSAGFTMFTYGSDIGFLQSACRDGVESFRRRCGLASSSMQCLRADLL